MYTTFLFIAEPNTLPKCSSQRQSVAISHFFAQRVWVGIAALQYSTINSRFNSRLVGHFRWEYGRIAVSLADVEFELIAYIYIRNMEINDCRRHSGERAGLSIKFGVFNDNNLGAHTGIIPTEERAHLSSLSGPEKNIHDAITHHYLVQFYPNAQIKSVTGEIECVGHWLKVSGEIAVKVACQIYLGKADGDDNGAELPLLCEGKELACSTVKIGEK